MAKIKKGSGGRKGMGKKKGNEKKEGGRATGTREGKQNRRSGDKK